MGNKTYSANRDDRIKSALQFLFADDNPEETTILWITLTKQYTKTPAGRRASWEAVHRELKPALRIFRDLGMDAYIAVKEAHAEGGCHVHIAARWKGVLAATDLIDGKIRLADDTLRAAIKAAWEGHVDVRIADDERVGLYLTKEMGKSGHAEAAIKRAYRHWSEDGDERHRQKDMKKIYGLFYASNLKIRMICTSRNLPAVDDEVDGGPVAEACLLGVEEEESGEGSENDLIKSKNNGTRPTLLEVLPIPKSLVCFFAGEPFTAEVERDSLLYTMLVHERDLHHAEEAAKVVPAPELV